MQHVAKVLPLVSEARLLDNSSRDDPFKQIAVVKKGVLTFRSETLPAWAKTIIKDLTGPNQR